MLNPRFTTVLAMIVLAAVTRLAPHPPNLTAMAALALFAGAHLSDRRLAIAIPLAALLFSDLALGIQHQWTDKAVQGHMWLQYVTFTLTVMMGFTLQNGRSALRVGAVTVLASCMFFVLTNFGEWVFQPWYPKTLDGLVAAYVAAIPFFRNTLLGDLIYTVLLFGGFHLLERRFLFLRQAGRTATAVSV